MKYIYYKAKVGEIYRYYRYDENGKVYGWWGEGIGLGWVKLDTNKYFRDPDKNLIKSSIEEVTLELL